jgi:hypothetical protein
MRARCCPGLVSDRESISQLRICLWASLGWEAGHRGVDVSRTPHLPGPSSATQGARCLRWPTDWRCPARSRRQDRSWAKTCRKGKPTTIACWSRHAKCRYVARWPRSEHCLPLLHSLVRAKGAFGGFRASAGVLAAGPALVKLYSYFRILREQIWRSGESSRPAARGLRSAGSHVAPFSANLQAFRLV